MFSLCAVQCLPMIQLFFLSGLTSCKNYEQKHLVDCSLVVIPWVIFPFWGNIGLWTMTWTLDTYGVCMSRSLQKIACSRPALHRIRSDIRYLVLLYLFIYSFIYLLSIYLVKRQMNTNLQSDVSSWLTSCFFFLVSQPKTCCNLCPVWQSYPRARVRRLAGYSYRCPAPTLFPNKWFENGILGLSAWFLPIMAMRVS